MNTLLFSSSMQDPISDIALRSPEKFDIHQIIDIDQLASTLLLDICPEDGISRIAKCSTLDTTLASFDRQGTLINRCHFHNELKFSTENMVSEYFVTFRHKMAAFIDSFKHTTAKAGLYSVIGDNLPLYLQWKVVHDKNIAVKTPAYHYAFASEPPLIETFKSPIYTNPFAVDNWQVNTPPEKNWHTFVVDRPEGKPVCAFVFGSEVLAFSPFSPEDPLPMPLQNTLKHIGPKITQAFSSYLGEILFFVAENDVFFAAYSNLPTTAECHPHFPQTLERGLSTLETTDGLCEDTLNNVA